MAQVAGTTSTYDTVGAREELHNQIHRITPEDTPFFSMIKTGPSLKSVHPEWQTDVLRAPASNAQISGDVYAYTAKSPTVRVGNYSQISLETGLITESLDAIDKAGRDLEIEYQKLKSGLVLRKDIELAMVSNIASVAGNDTTARKSAGFPAWITTNDNRGATGADGGFSAGIVAAATNGTQRAFTKVIMDAVLAAVYTSGGHVKTIMAAPYVKTVFVTFMSDANVAPFRYGVDKGGKHTIIGTADFYEGPFGTIEFVPNRVMAEGGAGVARNALFIDPTMIDKRWLRPLAEDKKVARTGDATPYVIIGEWSMIMKNEAAHGIAADLFGLTAAS